MLSCSWCSRYLRKETIAQFAVLLYLTKTFEIVFCYLFFYFILIFRQHKGINNNTKFKIKMTVGVPNPPIDLWLSILYWKASLRLLPIVIQPMTFIGDRNLAPSLLCNLTTPVGLLFFDVQMYIA